MSTKKTTASSGIKKSSFQTAILHVIQDMLYERNLKQKTLAAIWQVDQSTVSRIFSGASPLSITKIEQVAAFFDTDTYSLLHQARDRQLIDTIKARTSLSSKLR